MVAHIAHRRLQQVYNNTLELRHGFRPVIALVVNTSRSHVDCAPAERPSALSSGELFRWRFCLRVSGASRGLLDDGVNFAADENRHARHVKPQHQNDDCPQ